MHELFIKRVTEFTMRAAKGEDIADELHSMLAKWLINHIASEDPRLFRTPSNPWWGRSSSPRSCDAKA